MNSHSLFVPNVKKIAVLRANALGDFIFILPALKALRSTYPQAKIILLGKPWHKEFLSGRNELVDQVIPIPPYRGVRDEPGINENQKKLEQFFTQIKKEKLDIVVQLHGGGRYSNPFVKKLGAKLTVGLKTPDAIPLDRWLPYIYYQNEILRYLEVVSLIGASTNKLSPQITVTENDLKEAEKIMLRSLKPLVILHPGSTDPRRHWPVENFTLVGNALAKKGLNVAITGTGKEKYLIKKIIKKMSYKVENLCDKLSLNGLTGIFSYSSLIISNDTGPLYLARAVGTPNIGLYWCGNMINGGPITQAKNRSLISWVIHCPMCGWNCTKVFPFEPKTSCDHLTSFVTDITPQEVIDTAMELVS